METNIALETFISTCDDMLIAQEGAMDVIKRVGRTAINISGWKNVSEAIMRLVDVIKAFFRDLAIKRKTKGGISLQVPKKILALYQKVFAVSFGNIDLMEVEVSLTPDYMEGHFKSKNSPYRQLMSTKKSEFANYDYSEFVKYDFSTKFEPLLKKFEKELATSRLLKIGTNTAESIASIPLVNKIIIKAAREQSGKEEATTREVQEAFAHANRYCANIIKVYNYRIASIMKVFSLSSQYKEHNSGRVYDAENEYKENELVTA